jgi:purine-binding chemotaxis protein CheW
MRPLPVEPLAGAPEGVVGMSVVRGHPTPMVDLAALLTGRNAGANWSRLVTIEAGARTVGLLVDGVTDVREVNASRFAALPPLWEGERPPAVAGVGALDRELYFILDSMKMLGAVEADVGRGRA